MYVLHAKIKNWAHLFIGKIICLMRLTRKVSVDDDDVTDDMGLHSVSDLYAMLQHSFTLVAITSDGDVKFPE